MSEESINAISAYFQGITKNKPESKLGVQNHSTFPNEDITETTKTNFILNGTINTSNSPPVHLSCTKSAGRFLVASRDIEANETIFWEPYMVLAPKCGAGPTCLKCFQSLSEQNWCRCPKCGCPVCEDKCEGMHHSQEECRILEKRLKDLTFNLNVVKQINVILTVLRTYLKVKESQYYKSIFEALQSNVDMRKKTPLYKFVDDYIVDFIQNTLQLSITDEFIHRVCGVFDTNAFDATVKGNRLTRGLLPLASLMNHSCVPNTQHWTVGEYCVVKASLFIRKGQPITNTYTQTLWGTKARKYHLQITKYFDCSCKRCQDPTELGSHFSSILCNKCTANQGYLLPDPNGDLNWICNACENKIPASLANNIIKISSSVGFSAIEEMDIDSTFKTYQRLCKMIGKQHSGTVKLIFILLEKISNNSDTAKDCDLLEAIQLSDYLIGVVSQIEPGATKMRGHLLLTKLKVMVALTDRFLQDNITPEYKEDVIRLLNDDKMNKALDIALKECETILQLDLKLEEFEHVKQRWTRFKSEVRMPVMNQLRIS